VTAATGSAIKVKRNSMISGGTPKKPQLKRGKIGKDDKHHGSSDEVVLRYPNKKNNK
jgi:hypothetical protein